MTGPVGMDREIDDVDDQEDDEKPEAVPSPTLLQFEAAIKVAEAAATAALWEVFRADEGPEPYDQELLYRLRKGMKELENFLWEKRKDLKARVIWENDEPVDLPPRLEDPPGYPAGTHRYGPLSPEQVKYLRTVERGFYHSGFVEVKGRDGIILYCLPGYKEPDPNDFSLTGNVIPFEPPKLPKSPKSPEPLNQDDEEIDLLALYMKPPSVVQPQVKAGSSKGDRFPKKEKKT
jgi:hypothetical protein